MGRRVLKDCFIRVNQVDLSGRGFQVGVTMAAPSENVTAFGDAGRQSRPGVSEDSFALSFRGDFDAGQVDATLSPLSRGVTEFPVSVRPVSDDASATNPQYDGTARLYEYEPLSGALGDVHNVEVTFEVQGEIAVNTTTNAFPA